MIQKLSPILLCTVFLFARSSANTVVKGSGSTLLGPLVRQWVELYSPANTSITYDFVGSGQGLQDVQSNASHFAGSEATLDESVYKETPGILMVPVVTAPIALIFNLNGTTALTLSRDVIAQIFSLDIQYWNHPAILALNRHIELPNEKINVIVRSDSSGSSFVLTSALKEFGWTETNGCSGDGVQCSITKRLGGCGLAYTAVSGGSTLARTVQSTPYAFGYVSVDTALEYHLSFAIVQNRAGVLTVAGRSDAQLAADASTYDPLRLTAELHDTVGYPILGIAYLVFWENLGESEDCAIHTKILEFLYWIYTVDAAKDVIKGAHLVPLTDQVVNRVLKRLWSAKCGEVPWKSAASVTSVATQDSITENMVNHVAISYHSHSLSTHLVATELHGTNRTVTVQRASSHLASSPHGVLHSEHIGTTWIPLWSTPLAFVYNIGVQGLRVSVELPMAVLAAVLRGEVTYWQHPLIKANGSYLPLPNRTIELVGDPSMYRPVLEILGMEGDVKTERMVNSTSEHDVAKFVSLHTGSMAVLTMDVARSWGLSEVYPIALGMRGGVAPDESEYPFLALTYLGMEQHHIVTEAETEALLAAVEVAVWLSAATPHGEGHGGIFAHEATSTALQHRGVSPLPPSSGVKEAVNAFFEGVTVNGEVLYPAPPGSEPILSTVEIVFVVLACVVCCGVLFLTFTWSYIQERAKVRRLTNNSAIAENSAAFIAEMRLEELDYLKGIADPNKIQQSFIKIVDILTEYRRYLPSHVLLRGSSDEFNEEDSLLSGRTREILKDPELCTAVSTTNSNSSGGRCTAGKNGKKGGREKFTLGLQKKRCTVACVHYNVRPSQDPLGASQNYFLTLLEVVVSQVNSTSRKNTSVQIANDGDVFLSWNTTTSVVSHQTAGLDVVCGLKKHLLALGVQDSTASVRDPSFSSDYISQSLTSSSGEAFDRRNMEHYVHIGLATDSAYCGNVGGDSSRVFVMNGAVVNSSRTLMQYAQQSDLLCVAEDSVIGERSHLYNTYRVDLLSLAKDKRRTYLWSIVGKETSGVSEWMYQMQQLEDGRKKTLPGLASLMWESIRKRDATRLRVQKDELVRTLAATEDDSDTATGGGRGEGGSVGAGRICSDRLLRCAEDVLVDRERAYYITPMHIVGYTPDPMAQSASSGVRPCDISIHSDTHRSNTSQREMLIS